MTPAIPFRVETYGLVPDEVLEFAAGQVRELLRIADGHVQSARVMLAMAPDRASEDGALVRALITIDGRLVLVQAEEETAQAAIERMVSRLRTRLVRLTLAWEARRVPVLRVVSG